MKSNLTIYSVNDPCFAEYGRVLDLDTAEIVAEGNKVAMPDEGSVYTASLETFEKLPIADTVKNEIFGTLPSQLGFCYGHSHKLNAFEWHTCSEVNIATEDLILIFGSRSKLEEGNRYNSANVKAFLLKKGQAIEVYATTLHFCPIEVNKTGFGCVVGLLKGTNLPLEKETDDKLLFRQNKWLIAHEENAALIARGAVAGVYGENYEL